MAETPLRSEKEHVYAVTTRSRKAAVVPLYRGYLLPGVRKRTGSLDSTREFYSDAGTRP